MLSVDFVDPWIANTCYIVTILSINSPSLLQSYRTYQSFKVNLSMAPLRYDNLSLISMNNGEIDRSMHYVIVNLSSLNPWESFNNVKGWRARLGARSPFLYPRLYARLFLNFSSSSVFFFLIFYDNSLFYYSNEFGGSSLNVLSDKIAATILAEQQFYQRVLTM